jgi:hypothetical protein
MKHYILDKRIVHVAVTALIVETVLVVIIGTNNVYTTNANRDMEKQADIKEAKAKYWEGRYRDLTESGTCLERTPKYEKVVG